MRITARCDNPECKEYAEKKSVFVRDSDISDIPNPFGEPIYYVYKCLECGEESASEVIEDNG